MSSRVSLILRTVMVAAAGFALLLLGLSQANAVEMGLSGGERTAQTGPGDDGPIIQATERISIPYGFSGNLLLGYNNAAVVASGEGACTDGETITIAFTITQAANNTTAMGVWNGDCTGDLQTWTSSANATPSPNFSAGPAEACAFAETFDDQDDVTDSQDWCDPVMLTTTQSVFLPYIVKP